MKRSDFLKLTLAAAAGLPRKLAFAGAERTVKTTPGPLPRRPLGNTGEHLSIIGFGGNIAKGEDQQGASRMIRQAYEQGVNYFDVAPAYGNAEDVMGEPLEPFRKENFLSCKTAERDAAGSQRELETSLKKLRTDYFDLYQLHYITSKEDIETAFGPGGAMEPLVRAREKGINTRMSASRLSRPTRWRPRSRQWSASISTRSCSRSTMSALSTEISAPR